MGSLRNAFQGLELAEEVRTLNDYRGRIRVQHSGERGRLRTIIQIIYQLDVSALQIRSYNGLILGMNWKDPGPVWGDALIVVSLYVLGAYFFAGDFGASWLSSSAIAVV